MENIDLSSFFKTKPEAADFSERLSKINEKIYENEFDLEHILAEQFGLLKKDEFITLLRNNNINGKSADDLRKFLAKLQKTVSDLSVLSISIAFEPTDDTLKILSQWFMLNVNKQILFDIKHDPSLVAGCALLINGKYADFSVKSKFEEILKNTLQVSAPPISSQAVSGTPSPDHQSIDHFTLGR